MCAAVDQAQRQQADAGKMLHPQQGVFAEPPVPARDAKAQAAKPDDRAERHAADARGFCGKNESARNPVVRHQICAEAPARTRARRGCAITRTKPVMNAECGCSFSSSRASIFSEASPSLDGMLTLLAVRNFAPRNNQKDETEHFHHGLHQMPALKNDGKAGERNRAINHLHRRRAEADEHRPQETAPRAFVEDGEVDRPDGNRGKKQRAEKTGEAGQQNGMRVRHGSIRARPARRLHLQCHVARRARYTGAQNRRADTP